jgi:hypothetical protein
VGNGGVRRTLLTILNISCSGDTENGLYNSLSIIIFSAILVGLKILYSTMMKADSIPSKYEYDAKHNKK